jgi:hypothetical protein
MSDASAPRSGPPREPKFRFPVTTDRALVGGGVGMAFCSVVFAGYMITSNPQPYFPGLEYLAIFSQPSHGRPVQVAAHPAPILARLETPGDPNGVDPTPTGSIGASGGRGEPPDAAGLPPPRYRIVSASRDAAWLESERGFRQVRPGEALSGFGRIVAIERRKGGWALVADSGSILQLSESDAQSFGDQGPGGRFIRPMIFGRQPQ